MKRSELDRLSEGAAIARRAFVDGIDGVQRVSVPLGGSLSAYVDLQDDGSLRAGLKAIDRSLAIGAPAALNSAVVEKFLELLRVVERWNANEADSSEIPASDHLVKP